MHSLLNKFEIVQFLMHSLVSIKKYGNSSVHFFSFKGTHKLLFSEIVPSLHLSKHLFSYSYLYILSLLQISIHLFLDCINLL